MPEKTYNFHIGGYQVLHKYLKDRKGKELTMNEVLTVGKETTPLKPSGSEKSLINIW